MSVEVSINCIPAINFSMQQNHVRVIRNVTVKNTGETDLENLEITFVFDPDFGHVDPVHVQHLAPGCALELTDVPVSISTSYLSNLTERIEGEIKAVVTCGETTLGTATQQISLLTFDQWGGIGVLPVMLAAFVTPNHPDITPIIRRASAILSKWTGSGAFDEYQTRDPNRVKMQMAAIYEAIAELGISYITSPAGYEDSGQRIRLVGDVIGAKLATCLDMMLLYASCLEAVGINPVLVLIRGHAFAGAWLVPESFPDSVNDDVSLITKRTAEGINEMLVVETTCMNTGAVVPFDAAVAQANAHLADTDRFQLFVDVLRARNGRIRPLPLRVLRDGVFEISEEDVPAERNADAPASVSETHTVAQVDRIGVDKQIIWERKLLDLSLRNSLLNTRITNNTVQLITAHVNKLEDALAAGVEFQILPKPADWDNPLMSAGIYQALNASDPILELVESELLQNRLYSYLNPEGLQRALTHLYRSSRLALEENGANTLYLAVGLLKWFETEASTRPRFAPILLMPVEIIRRPGTRGFVIRSRDEDTSLNITLLEMLRQDFGIGIGGLTPLPTDENGVDVPRILNVFRRAIMDRTGWDVEEQAILGNFSFSKFIMWNDIHNNADKLSRNPIVASLISGKTEWIEPETEEIALDEAYPAGTVALPIGADSSQFEAICAAVDNRSFILHGPPGTGKSQTITNIIANALYNGKKVLFVAEKMAALQVVQRRLEAIGLAPFCLELHSNKTKKSYILEQLKRTTEIVKSRPSEAFALKAKQINELRSELNRYVHTLHKSYPAGLSLYDCFTRYVAVDYGGEEVKLSADMMREATPEIFADLEGVVAEYRTATAMCGAPEEHPLEGINLKAYLASVRDEAGTLLADLSEAIGRYQEALDYFGHLMQFDLRNLPLARLELVNKLLELLLSAENLPAGLLKSGGEPELYETIRAAVTCGRQRDEVGAELLKDFSEAILTWDFRPWESKWRQTASQWWLPRALGRRKVKSQLKGYMRVAKKLTPEDVETVFTQLNRYAEYQRQLEGMTPALAPVLGWLWNPQNANWSRIELAVASTRLFTTLVLEITKDIPEAMRVKNEIAHHLECGPEAFRLVNAERIQLTLDTARVVKEKLERVRALLLTEDFSDRVLDYIRTLVDRWGANIGRLRDWVAYQIQREHAIGAGLEPLVAAVESGKVGADDIDKCFAKSLYRSYAEYILSCEPDMNAFYGELFNEKIERFRRFCAEFERLTREELYARLASGLPALQREAAQGSEVGILQRNIRNGGRGTSIRRLFDQIPELLTRMCPCMLMSPISVAQYIDAERVPFDLVIFDEASQMPTSEAVGAIARGRNVIVVGDPKQMPPTTFFTSNNFDEENADKEDMENILEDCLALTMPSMYLRWHYRSRHESLIAFSNMKYYDNRLYTFPSPDDLTTKVGWQYVEGVYDRGRTRQNRAEAEAVVADIQRRLSDTSLPRRSIGVVTFNTNQQSLIEDLLTDLFSAHPELEAIAGETDEPIFIKNLENVQGDERDVILFSIGYGPDKDGRVALNFGPLNRDGGGRRLNVAVSRARYEMKVYSSLRSDQIDLNRTSAQGVADLKAFLEYAEKGRDFLARTTASEGSMADSLACAIAAHLAKQGYAVRTNVGCSGYRIDIGVVHPDNPDKYLLGILLDGCNYAGSRTARDRVVTQHTVLRQLGWRLHRVWSMDWWENPEKTLKSIVEAIEKAKAEPDVEPEPEKLPSNTQVKLPAPRMAQPEKDPREQPYKQCLQASSPLSSDEFVSGAHDANILHRIKAIVEHEAPISKNLLARRLIVSYGITRMGNRITPHFDKLLKRGRFVQTGQDDAIFIWAPGQNPREHATYRPESAREPLDIAPEEISVAIDRILDDQVSLPTDGLRREVAQLFGYTRLGDNVSATINRGLEYALEHGRIVIENDRARKANEL